MLDEQRVVAELVVLIDAEEEAAQDQQKDHRCGSIQALSHRP